jgi:hypothetical protein
MMSIVSSRRVGSVDVVWVPKYSSVKTDLSVYGLMKA